MKLEAESINQRHAVQVASMVMLLGALNQCLEKMLSLHQQYVAEVVRERRGPKRKPAKASKRKGKR